ncbi:hypothetical protein QJQ45_007898 [Haematococcus lacustris]|nr:hypothetical protein QJQ45_007898 [Haematococcus lacustris]
MILRLRSRDGLERVEVPDAATLAQLKQAISDSLHIPLPDMQLSKNPGLLSSKTPKVQGRGWGWGWAWGFSNKGQGKDYADLSNPAASLASLSITHGDMLFMLYQ